MKRSGIIILVLIFGLFLAISAFAEQYMVVYIEVDSGDIARVYSANEVGEIGSNTEIRVPVRKPNYHTSNGNHDGTPQTINNKISERTYTTIYAAESPGCRYIFYNGKYIKVCN